MQYGNPYGVMDGYGMGPGLTDFGLIFLILVIIGSIIGFILLIKYLLESSGFKREQESALEILKKRYAKGEIDKEEFDERKKDLL